MTPWWKLIDFEPKTLIGNVVLLEHPSGKTELGVKSDYWESLHILSMDCKTFSCCCAWSVGGELLFGKETKRQLTGKMWEGNWLLYLNLCWLCYSHKAINKTNHTDTHRQFIVNINGFTYITFSLLDYLDLITKKGHGQGCRHAHLIELKIKLKE